MKPKVSESFPPRQRTGKGKGSQEVGDGDSFGSERLSSDVRVALETGVQSNDGGELLCAAKSKKEMRSASSGGKERERESEVGVRVIREKSKVDEKDGPANPTGVIEGERFGQ